LKNSRNDVRFTPECAVQLAGHVVVARFLGLHVGEIEIGMNGDDASCRAEIGCADQLSVIDQIAVGLAGLEAQETFNAPTHRYAGFGDYYRVSNLVAGLSDGDSYTPCARLAQCVPVRF